MLPYGIIYFFTSLNAYINIKNLRHFNLIFFILIIMFYSLRNDVGGDWISYETYFNNIYNKYIVEYYDFEYGYWLLNYIGNFIFNEYRYLVLLIGIINGILYWKASNKYSNNFGILMLLSIYYMFYPTLEAFRQSITLFLFYFSLQFLNENPKKFIMLNILGLLFHRTGIFAFLLLIFNKNTKMRMPIVMFFLVFNFLEPFFLNILGIFPSFERKYYWYFHYAEFEGSFFTIKLVEYLILIIVYLIFSYKHKLSSMEKITNNLLTLGFIIQISIGQLSEIAYRMTYYSDIGVIFAYTFIYDRIKNPVFKYLYVLFLIFYVFFRFYRVFPYDNPLFIYSIDDK